MFISSMLLFVYMLDLCHVMWLLSIQKSKLCKWYHPTPLLLIVHVHYIGKGNDIIHKLDMFLLICSPETPSNKYVCSLIINLSIMQRKLRTITTSAYCSHVYTEIILALTYDMDM